MRSHVGGRADALAWGWYQMESKVAVWKEVHFRTVRWGSERLSASSIAFGVVHNVAVDVVIELDVV